LREGRRTLLAYKRRLKIEEFLGKGAAFNTLPITIGGGGGLGGGVGGGGGHGVEIVFCVPAAQQI